VLVVAAVDVVRPVTEGGVLPPRLIKVTTVTATANAAATPSTVHSR